jgi:exopolyphosphatase / guanosine-5'-triphosphate,3'-diphosphate pyrophosphatase
MIGPVTPRWEWRCFGVAEDPFSARVPERIEESDELYLLSCESEASVKVRNGLVDVKHRLEVDAGGLELWTPVLKQPFPLSAADAGLVLATLRASGPPLGRAAGTVDELVGARADVRAVAVHKRRARHSVAGCMAELTELRTDRGMAWTIAVEAEDPARIRAVVHELGLAALPVVCMARGLKALAGFGAPRFAVIDVGTNSIKFHVGERQADGSWRTIADRAEVTRLGQGLEQTGRLTPEPVARTVEAIAVMADEAGRHGAVAVAAVGTAGLRIAANAAEVLAAIEERSGVRVEVISGEEEARLAYLATRAALGLSAGSLVVFDTGGGSSQFTFGDGVGVHERFSLDVGAARFTERYGLAGAVSESTLSATRMAITAELRPLARRPAPDLVVGMGGAVTNLAAVKHSLSAYDADIVHGTTLDRAEIERQIEHYRSCAAAERRQIVGLQPNRAELILAGACIADTILASLGRDALTVSDRGLRHGLLVERFGAEPSVPASRAPVERR